MALVTLTALFWTSVIIVFVIVMAPASRFFDYGWRVRKQEFADRFAGKDISNYFGRFWSATIRKKGWGDLSPEQQFDRVYNILAGRQIYVVPMIILGVCLIMFGGLAIEFSIRLAYESYIQNYIDVQKSEGKIFPDAILHLSLIQIDRVFLPFPPVSLSLAGVTALAGAYLNVVNSTIAGYKTRTLLSSDLLWSSFRLVIAIPLGYAIASSAPGAVGSLVAFGLGAFPIGAIIKLLRRLTARSLNQAEVDDQDSLLKLSGVTPDVSARLNDEEIYAPQQLAQTDPVSLAVRAGLSFDLVVNLVAQSQVWCFVGDTASKMARLGCGDARMIHRFFGPGAPQTPLLAALSAETQIEPNALQAILQVIAADPFTVFLAGL